MKQHIEDPRRPGIALCDDAYTHLDPRLTVVFCQKCIQINQSQVSNGEKGDYLDGFDDGIEATIKMLENNSGEDGAHGFVPAYKDAAAFLKLEQAKGTINVPDM